MGFFWWLSGKESSYAGDAGDMSSIPGSERSPGVGHGNPLQYSRWNNPTDREACWAMICGVAKSWTQLKRVSTLPHTY